MVKYLVEERIANLNAMNTYGKIPLHMAVFESLDVIKYFEKRGADINIKDWYGNSLLHYTAEGG
ncbi:MAG: ankyrin repeat domain-containing protein [Wolbachia sp.]